MFRRFWFTLRKVHVSQVLVLSQKGSCNMYRRFWFTLRTVNEICFAGSALLSERYMYYISQVLVYSQKGSCNVSQALIYSQKGKCYMFRRLWFTLREVHVIYFTGSGLLSERFM